MHTFAFLETNNKRTLENLLV
ncbi:hypothetical protein AGR1B_pTi0164 [Agrobacterium fabacearum S56]|uniref:Uncharacterized protein n=1 Tax=Agrobacterium deltaense Zutra 3/1 TaxID=1183427 RepID=A0A1S7S7Y0_9HYPH|nr:hypothetical protein AGR1B_pTi0164 [Agrobacterium fabacearum S56]CUX64044.1 hypothetical protein AGR7C_pTi0221 [Agrobacterium deltaense Zutra 3/1]